MKKLLPQQFIFPSLRTAHGSRIHRRILRQPGLDVAGADDCHARLLWRDTGARALESFLHNVIDPKGKKLSENRDNIRTLFDLMAEYVPQQQDVEEDKSTFVKAMNTATDLLMENSLLSDEFRMMGIDFETVLMDEREQAIRRWMHR